MQIDSVMFPKLIEMISCLRTLLRRLLLLTFWFVALAVASAQPKVFPARGFAKILTPEKANERLDRFRKFHGINPAAEDFHHGYLLQFRLEHYPRRGEVSSREGSLCGLAFGHGLIRLDLMASTNEKRKAYLLRNGPEPEAWLNAFDGNESKQLVNTDLFQPLAQGMGHTLFDLMMPFVFWDAKYQKSGRVIGRPSHLFEFSPPAWASEAVPALKKIRLALDDVYEAPLRVEFFGRRGVPDKTFGLVSLKKVGETWIAKTLDFRDALTSSRTRFTVIAAATDLDLGREVFTPAGLDETPKVSEELLQSIE
ncbi:MAG: hypothetical protein HOB63_08065 [Opitutae bacterium]|nr:hypothetical protein [Opitutae bacterium]